jgi:hypothetical protein
MPTSGLRAPAAARTARALAPGLAAAFAAALAAAAAVAAGAAPPRRDAPAAQAAPRARAEPPRPLFEHVGRGAGVRLRAAPGVPASHGLLYLTLRDSAVVDGRAVRRDVTLVVAGRALAAAAAEAGARLASEAADACPPPGPADEPDTAGVAAFEAEDGGEPTSAYLRCATDPRSGARYGVAGYELIRPRLPLAAYRRLLDAALAAGRPGGPAPGGPPER